MNYARIWRDAAREAMANNAPWTPTNLPRVMEMMKARYEQTRAPQFCI